MSDRNPISNLHATRGAPTWFWVGLALMLLLGIVLRIAGIDRHSVWFDEAFGVHLAPASYKDLFTGAAKDQGNPPLYYMMVKFVIEKFGADATSLRMPSAVFAILTIPALAVMAFRLYGPMVGVVAAALCTLSPIAIELSNEARVYALVQLLAVVSTWLFIEWRVGNSRWLLVAYVAVTTLLCYSHYFALAVPLAHTLVVLFYGGRREQVTWLAVLGVLLVAGLPWVPAFRDQLATPGNLARGGQGWMFQFAATPVVQSLGRTFAWRDSNRIMLVVAMVIALATFIGPALWGIVKAPGSREWRILLAAWWLIPILLPALAAGLGVRIYSSRYSIVGLPAAMVLLAAGLSTMRPKVAVLLATTLTVATAASLMNYYVWPLKDDWRLVEAKIASGLHANSVVVCDPDFEVLSYLYYADRRHRTGHDVVGIVVPPGNETIPKGMIWRNGQCISRAAENVDHAFEAADSVWLALCASTENRERYEAWFRERGFTVSAAENIAPRHVLMRFDRTPASSVSLQRAADEEQVLAARQNR